MQVIVVLFIHHASIAIEKLVENGIEFPGDSMLQVTAMQWVLLHLTEDSTLENVT